MQQRRLAERQQWLQRPNVFGPTDREQEVLQWRDWCWSLKQYLVVVGPLFLEDMDAIENHLDTEVCFELQDDKEQERSRFLQSLLGSLLQGRLLGLVRYVASFNGGEALRQLLSNCQPKARNRTMSLLQGVMSYPAFSMKGSLVAQILKLEEHFNQYEMLGGKIGEDMKAAVLLRSMSGQLKTHLNMTLNEGSSYTKIRATTRWFVLHVCEWRPQWSCSYGDRPHPEKGKGKDSKGKGKDKRTTKETRRERIAAKASRSRIRRVTRVDVLDISLVIVGGMCDKWQILQRVQLSLRR